MDQKRLLFRLMLASLSEASALRLANLAWNAVWRKMPSLCHISDMSLAVYSDRSPERRREWTCEVWKASAVRTDRAERWRRK